MSDSYLPRWRKVAATAGAVVAPDERLSWPQTAAMGVQHVIAMFGATVLAPILMGFNPNIAILMSGIGTLIFFVVTGGRVPSYLGSSFAFIGVVIAATGYAGHGPERQPGRGARRHRRLRPDLHADRRAGGAHQRAPHQRGAGARPRGHRGRRSRAGRGRALDRAADAAGGHRRGGRGDRPQPRERADQEHGADRLRHLDAGRDLRQRRADRGVHARHGAAAADPDGPDRREPDLRGADQRPRAGQADRPRAAGRGAVVRRCRPSRRRCSASTRCC